MRVVLSILSILSLYGCQPVYAQTQGEAVRAYFTQVFAGAASLTTSEVNYESKKLVLGHPEYRIIQDISFAAIAAREGRLFVNPDVNQLPQGNYTFIVTADGDIEFGLIKNDLEIGVKHFQIARGRAVVAAGEFTKHGGATRLSIRSGTFSRHLKYLADYSERETIRKLEQAFLSLWGLSMKMEYRTLYADPEHIDLAEIERYCIHPEFFVYHEKTICSQFVNEQTHCEKSVSSP